MPRNRKRTAKATREAAERAQREAWRASGASYWPPGDARTRQRTAMVIAAFFCDDKHDPELADWLLCARPEYAREVATGVAAHALREGMCAVWDALAAAGAMDHNQASELLETEGILHWAPRPEWLVPFRRPDLAAITRAREVLR